ncbi:unnamed protein product, partial [Didymodactylos carnosus]
QQGVSVLFKLNTDHSTTCEPYAAIKPEDSCMEDEKEVLFSIGRVSRINSVDEMTGQSGMWCIELTSTEDDNTRSAELRNYLKQQLGETCDLLTLGDFPMKMGQYEKADIYYRC